MLGNKGPAKSTAVSVASQIADLKGKIAAGKRKEDAVAKDGEEESRAKKKGPGKKAEAMPKKVNKVAKDPEDRKPRKEKKPKKQNKNQKEIKKKDDTRKRFTSRAYHQAKQAALRIGKEAQEAKELGRTAFQKAAQEWDLAHTNP